MCQPQTDPVSLAEYKACRLCPRMCGVDRVAGERGVCGETADCRVAQVGPHFGEEPPFVGSGGSGTVFFSGCSSRCFFCQNHRISLDHVGDILSVSQLVQRARQMLASGVENINVVTGDHFWPHVRALCEELRRAGCGVPMLFNCSGYVLAERVPEMAEFIDIFLPDFNFADPDLAQTCMGDRRYPEIAMAAVREMVRLKGFLCPWDETGAQPAQSGTLIRHLVLPGHVENSLEVIRRLHDAFGPELPLSVMSQFTPTESCHSRGKLCRRLKQAEYEQVFDLVEELGFERVFLQMDLGDDDFMPDFDSDAPFAGNVREHG